MINLQDMQQKALSFLQQVLDSKDGSYLIGQKLKAAKILVDTIPGGNAIDYQRFIKLVLSITPPTCPGEDKCPIFQASVAPGSCPICPDRK